MKSRLLIISLIVFVNMSAAQLIAQPLKVQEVAKTAERPSGAPKYSDVCFRYGWIRKDKFPTVEDAKKAILAFHATRIDWFYPGSHTINPGATYVSDEAKAFIDWCHQEGMKVGGAMNTNTTHLPWKYKKHHLTRYVGEVNNSDFVAEAIRWGVAQIDAGIDFLVCDDIFKYDNPRKELWSKRVLEKIREHRKDFEIAGNNGGSIGAEYVKRYAVDFHYSDNNFVPNPKQWWESSKAHRALNSALLLHPNRHISADVRRRMIALAYANGAHVITPWDEYIHGKKRLFADPAEFAAIYGFVRFLGQRGYLDHYEDAFVAGYDLKETRYGETPPVIIEASSGKLSVFGRAQPQQLEGEVAVHLIESGKSQSSKLKFRNKAFFSNGKITATLCRPKDYQSALHQRSASSKDHLALAEVIRLDVVNSGVWSAVEVPLLNPWGLLVLSISESH